MDNFIRSLQKNRIGIIVMVFSAICTSFGQYFWKLSVSEGVSLLYLFIGFSFYGFGALFMILAFRYGSLSVLHPMLSLSYVFAVIIGFYFLQEAITTAKLISLGLIFFGIVMLGIGDE